MSEQPLPLMSAWGIEIEYMVVDRESLDVRPIVDEVLRDAVGGTQWVEDVDDGAIGWSNELVSHVLEMKCAAPVPTLVGLAAEFQRSVGKLQQLLQKRGACAMPGGMHPWMDPARETRLWPHESGAIYRAYDALYDCHRHGWANLQSMHINLPFADESEFARLMAAVRLVVPLIPALAASSPVVEQRRTRRLDSRLSFYRSNATKTPAMAGDVVPEAVFTFDGYKEKVLAPISAELRAIGAPPELSTRDWLNARGAISRFDRMAIEIRVTDTQECPRADIAVAAAIGGLVRMLVEQRTSTLADQQKWKQSHLVALFKRTIRHGPEALLADERYVRLFGVAPSEVSTAGQLWRSCIERDVLAVPRELEEPLETIVRDGTLAERLLRALGSEFDRADLQFTWRRLCHCLAEGRSFLP
ncbi:MAG: glutamate-cysteine ligase family protein [Planctomycetota bacterium]